MSLSIDRRINELPPMPRSLARVEEICQGDDIDMAELAGVIETDPMLTANILKSANSPFYGFSREITSVKHAATLLGANMIRGFAIAQTMRRSLGIDLSAYGLSEDTFLDMSEGQRALAFHWMSGYAVQKLEVLSPAAFMMEVGKIVIAQELSRHALTWQFREAIRGCDDVTRVEIDHVGRGSAEVAARIFSHWRFETKVVKSIRFMDEPDHAPEEVAEYAWMLKAIGTCLSVQGRLERRDVDRARKLVKARKLGEKAFKSAVKIVQKGNKAVLS